MMSGHYTTVIYTNTVNQSLQHMTATVYSLMVPAQKVPKLAEGENGMQDFLVKY